MDRRQFVKLSIMGATTLATGGLLASCASGEPEPQAEPTTSNDAPAAAEPTPLPDPEPAPEPQADPAPEPEPTANTLVIYYSHPETTEASDPANLSEEEENSVVVADGQILGNTQFVAQIIARETGADLHRIETPHTYPIPHDQLIAQAQQEQNEGFRPEITGGIPDLSAYDTIFFGYPIWWAKLPPAVTSFLEQADFSDKDVYLFNTHGGSGDANTPATIAELQEGANIADSNYVVSRDVVANAEPEIVAWVNSLGLSE